MTQLYIGFNESKKVIKWSIYRFSLDHLKVLSVNVGKKVS
jgi:hypothetical protein